MYRILQGDVLDRLRELPSESVHCVVTSPPYWGLRDYGTASWEGGDAECDHLKAVGTMSKTASTLRSDGREHIGHYEGEKGIAVPTPFRGGCGKCGATRIDQQLGLEATPAEFVAKMVAVFREVRRVLRKDGTAWVNMGDSYAGSWGAQGRDGELAARSVTHARAIAAAPRKQSRTGSIPGGSGLKPKDLCGIPWRLAFALQADGWWLRQDIIWQKPNPMPESITDRCTKAHEYIFLLSKSAKYYYDADAIKEPVTGTANSRGGGVNPKAKYKTPDGWDTSKGEGGHGSIHRAGREAGKVKQNPSFSEAVTGLVDDRNKRSVWTVATQAYPEAHFATFPEELIVPCILAGCPEGGTVLDPFSGSGTTGVVALRYHRNYLGIELSAEYAAMSERRITNDAPLFNQGEITA